MPKLSDINMDTTRFRGKGIRPWNDTSVVKPSKTTSKNADKPLANREQTVSRPLVNREQTVSKPLANREQEDGEKNETVSKPLAKPLAIELAEREQTVSKPLANVSKIKKAEAIETLVGNERILLNFIFQKCKLIGSLESPTITTDEIRNLLKIKAEHLRNLIYRLSNKGVIEISKLKNGRAGWRKFQFSKEVFQYLSLNHTVSNALANREHTVSNALAKPLAEPLASSSSSSGSIYNNINTTTTSDTRNAMNVTISEEWQNIDIEPLSKIGFTKTHLVQIASQNKLPIKAVQDSIYAFAFDLNENAKAKNIKGDPINFFMGIIRNGKIYTPPSNYESPQDKSMRVYLERMREIEQRRAAVEKEACDLAFKEWFYKLSEEEITKLMPSGFKYKNGSKICEESARNYFLKEIWINRREDILAQN